MISSILKSIHRDLEALPGPATQTLEDLRKSAGAAWLWDGMRGRLVWANAAGIAAFDGQSIFDLIDRVFDPLESGVAVIADLTKTLKRDEIKKVALEFPSTGHAEILNCECWLHTLADGRSGLLVFSPAPVAAAENGNDIFGELPVAAALLLSDGKITKANAMASALFDVTTQCNLSDLLGNADRAEKLLGRLQSTNLVSAIEPFEGLYGRREARLTLRRLSGAHGPFAILVIDDITERRNMERQLAELPAPVVVEASKPPLNDAHVFEVLARSLNDAISKVESKPEVEKPKLEVAVKKEEPRKPAKPSVQPPRAVVNALEGSGAALIIAQDNVPAFVSKKALQMLGFERVDQLLENPKLLQDILSGEGSRRPISWNCTEDKKVDFEVFTNSIPWINGPAKQYVLRSVKSLEKPTSVLAPAVVAPAVEQLQVMPVQQIQTTAIDRSAVGMYDAEDELKSILDIASDGIITLDQQGAILSFSAGAESIFGLRSAEVKSKSLAEFFTSDSRKILLQYLASLQGPGLGAVFNDGREVNAVVKQGGTVPLFLTVGKLQTSKSTAAFCAVVRDITSWKRTEKELREAKETAEAASRQKSDFLARISHELRTPLNAIIGFSDVMRLEKFGEIRNDKYRGYVNDIHSSGGHLLALINDLLDLSKIEAGKMELNFTAVNVADCADHAIKLLQETATRGRVLVRKSLPEKLPRVVADLRAMRQVMLNLLSNAIKFTDPGGQVIISAAVAPSGELTLKLKDTGIGMNVLQMQDALEPFKRVETSGRETQGTGLGLPLTKALVEANRAKFVLSSEPGQGTLIEITFPTTRVLAE